MPSKNNKYLDFFQARLDRLRAANYIPLEQPTRWNQPMPLSDQDKQQFGSEPVGILDGWDYKTSPTDPNGKPLPQGAKGWNPDGSAWYGGNSAFSNWFLGAVNRLASSEYSSKQETSDQWANAIKLSQEGNAARSNLRFTGNFSEYFNQGLDAFKKSWAGFTAATDALGTSTQNVASGQATAAGESVANPNILNFIAAVPAKIGQVVGEIAKGGITALGEPAQELEQIRGGIANVSDSLSLGEKRTPIMLDAIPDEGLLAKFSWFPSFVYSLDVHSMMHEVFQAIVAPGSISEKLDKFSKGYEAGRILYSSVAEPALKAEFIRRFEAGENPYLLAEELQNPGRELAGQLIADPLNFIGAVFKASRFAGWLDDAGKLTKAAPEFADGARILAGAAGDAPELSKIAATSEYAQYGVDAVKKIIGNVTDKLNDFGLRAGTQAGKRNYFAHMSGQLFQGIAAGLQKTHPTTWADKTLDVLRGLMMITNGNADDFTKGIAYLSGSGMKMDILMSQAAIETGSLLNQLDPASVLKIVKDSGGDLAKLTAAFDGKITSAADKLIPNATKLGDLGVQGNAYRLMERALESKPGRLVSGAMSMMYMGLSPGYAARNLISNTVHMVLDVGVGAYVEEGKWLPFDDIDSKMLRESGGILPSHYGEGFAPVAAGLDAALPKKNIWDARYWSARFEQSSSKRLVYKVYKDTITTGIDTLFKSQAEELLRLGATKADITTLRNAFLNTRGNVEEAIKLVRDARAGGYIDLVRNLEHLTPDMRRYLNEYQLLDKYVDAIKNLPEGATLDEAIAAQNKLRQEVSEYARKFDGEYIHPDMRGPGFNDLNQITEFNHEGLIADNVADLFNRARSANQSFAGSLQEAVNKNIELARKTLGDEVIDAWFKEHPEFRALWSNEMTTAVQTSADDVADVRRAILNRPLKDPNYSIGQAWKELGMQGTAPEGISYNEFRELYIQQQMYPTLIREWAASRDALFGLVDGKDGLFASLKELTGDVLDQQSIDFAYAKYGHAIQLDSSVIRDGKAYMVGAEQWLDELIKVTDDVPANSIPVVNRAVDNGSTASMAQPYSESMGGIDKMFDDIESDLKTTWGNKRPVTDIDDALNYIEDFAKKEMPVVRINASEVSRRARNFAFHDYMDRKNIDLALGMVYPYSFWYSRTYANWLSRVASNAGTIAAYGKYKDYMAEIHAGLPEWWKYNINSDELLGLFPNNPLFFNLEATLNPLNGLTGTDFNDPYKTVNWFTTLLDGLGKLGPSVWTPLSIATAMGLYLQGEEDAASRTFTRLLPITQTIEAVGTSIFGLDPFSPALNQLTGTGLFSGGVDPYTANRAARALAAMVSEGIITEEQAVDAASTRAGQIWTDAMARAINERAPGQISSFLLGAGFRARTSSDLMIDEFQSKYSQTINLRDTLSPEEYAKRMNALRVQYPFMDTLLLARKGSDDRDSALAWNVLNRLPPRGGFIAEAAGIPSELVDKFYETKGDWSEWSESDRARFMAGVTDMRAILAIPTAAIRQEWNLAKDQYKQMKGLLEKQFGNQIGNKIDRFFQLKAESGEAAQNYLRSNPDVEQALDTQAQIIMSNKLLSAYYGGIDQIVGYYTGQMYEAGEDKFGDNITIIEGNYWDLYNGVSSTEARKYLKQHPELKQFWDFKDQYRANVLFPAVAALASHLPEGKPATARTNTEPNSLGQTGVLGALQQQQAQTIPPEVIINALGQENVNLILDNLSYGAQIPEVTQKRIAQIAQQAGLSEEAILSLIRQSLMGQ